MDALSAIIDPVFARDGRHWHPHAEAGGPFGGLHGGAVSGLIVAEMEREAREQGFGIPLSASVLLLRPTPMTTLETRTDVLRKGGRSGAIATALSADGKLVAKGTASFVTADLAEGAPAATPRPYDPSLLPPWQQIRRFQHKTLFDALDFRDDGAGTIWGRLLRPLAPFAAPLATVFAIADNATAFYLVTHRIAPRWGFPNIDIGIHVSRTPVGEWVGVEAYSDWRPDGRGFTEARLYDVEGLLGRACQTVVLVQSP
jgi:hypothetical protein